MSSASTIPSHRVLFGAAYYHEYRQEPRLERDLDLMAAAGFTVIRVGESVWSTWEPADGRFETEWLRPVLDGAHARGIGVVLGTPTYAVPPWLARAYPEIAGERRTGEPIPWGARQEVDFTHAAFRFHAERVIRVVLAAHADHPAVIGFQVDNEPGLELLHNAHIFERFVDRLRDRYGSVEALNEAWGLVYWSHRLSTWADLWRPDGNAQPQYDVAWREFQAALTTEFIAWQAGIVREYAPPGRLVTTCLALDRPALDERAVVAALDVTATNAYYGMQDSLALPATDTSPRSWTTGGVRELTLLADRAYATRQAPFLVTETNAGSIGAAWDNRPAYDGQWRQAAWALVARGATSIGYWHWHTLPFGAETFWGGVLPHSDRPGRTYAELAALGAEFARAGAAVAALEPDADVGFLLSPADGWYMQAHPPLATTAGGPDPLAHRGILEPFYRGAFDAGLQARVLHPDQLGRADALAAALPVLVVAAHHLAADATLDLLAEYAAAGGHLVLGPRTGYADPLARARAEPMPARLVARAGVHYEESSNLTGPIPLSVPGDSPLAGAAGARATRWVDALEPDDATVLAGYEHPHFGRWAALTSRAHGTGRITVVGTVPDPTLGEALFRWATPRPRAGWAGLPADVTVRTGTGADGSRVHVVHHWGWGDTEVTAPTTLRDLLSEQTAAQGDDVALGPWDVRVFAEPTGS